MWCRSRSAGGARYGEWAVCASGFPDTFAVMRAESRKHLSDLVQPPIILHTRIPADKIGACTRTSVAAYAAGGDGTHITLGRSAVRRSRRQSWNSRSAV